MNGELGGLFGMLTDRRVRWGILSVLFFLAAFLFMQTVAEIKGIQYIGAGIPAMNTITVQGEGEVFAVPDIATFTFSVVEERSTVKGAQDVATERTNSVLKYLRDNGEEEKDIKTLNSNIYPHYEYKQVVCTQFSCPPQGERELKGFEVRQTISVKVRDTEKAGTLLSGVGERGVQEVSGIEFTFDDDDALLREAREKAITDAKEKAAELSKQLKVRLVRVVNFNEFGQPIFFSRFDTAAEFGKGGEAAPVPEIPVGENKIVSNVTITYEIR